MELTLDSSNLYRTGSIMTFEDGQDLLVREPLDLQGTEEDVYYTVKKEDTLTKIAYLHYKARTTKPERYWWIIADANNVHNPLDISHLVGTDILVPNILTVLLNL